MSESQPEINKTPEMIVVPDFIQSTSGQTHEQPVGRVGERVTIPEDEFKGNPTRIAGHPSNPMTHFLANKKD